MMKIKLLTLIFILFQTTNNYAAQIKLDFSGTDVVDNINFYGTFLYENNTNLAVELSSVVYDPSAPTQPESNLIYTFASSPYFGTATFESTTAEFDPIEFNFNGVSVFIGDNFPANNVLPSPGFDLQTIFSVSDNAEFDQAYNLLTGSAVYFQLEYSDQKFNGTDDISNNDTDLIQASVYFENDLGFYSSNASNVSFTVVPIPAAAWLFMSGIIGLVWSDRKARKPVV